MRKQKFLQNVLQPLVFNSVLSGENILSEIKKLDPVFLRNNRYPVSLDVENMYHNIPRVKALDCLSHCLNPYLLCTDVDLCGISPRDIVRLVSVCLDNNHFKHNNGLFLQRLGLPIGNRLSEIL